MSKHNDGNTFMEVAAAHAEALRPLLVPGQLLAMSREPHPRTPLPAFPVPAAACDCGEFMHTIAQFWDQDRLWRAQFCFECRDAARLDSVAASQDLPVDAAVEGNSRWIRTPAQFLPSVDSAAWKSNPVIQDILPALGGESGEEAFHEALGRALGMHLANWAQSRLGGTPAFIQWPHEPACPQCQAPMRFVGQVSHDADFHWADLGVAYLFACAEHPEHTSVVCDTH